MEMFGMNDQNIWKYFRIELKILFTNESCFTFTNGELNPN